MVAYQLIASTCLTMQMFPWIISWVRISNLSDLLKESHRVRKGIMWTKPRRPTFTSHTVVLLRHQLRKSLLKTRLKQNLQVKVRTKQMKRPWRRKVNFQCQKSKLTSFLHLKTAFTNRPNFHTLQSQRWKRASQVSQVWVSETPNKISLVTTFTTSRKNLNRQERKYFYRNLTQLKTTNSIPKIYFKVFLVNKYKMNNRMQIRHSIKIKLEKKRTQDIRLEILSNLTPNFFLEKLFPNQASIIKTICQFK